MILKLQVTMSSYDEMICKKIYIIKFHHINIIVIPGSQEFDVLKNCGELCFAV